MVGGQATTAPVTADSLWIVKAGLADSNQITLAPFDYPTKALRHQSAKNYVHDIDTSSSLYRGDATYKVVPGLWGADDGYFSLQSNNYPTHYIRHASYMVKMSTISSTLDKQDASWSVEIVP